MRINYTLDLGHGTFEIGGSSEEFAISLAQDLEKVQGVESVTRKGCFLTLKIMKDQEGTRADIFLVLSESQRNR